MDGAGPPSGIGPVLALTTGEALLGRARLAAHLRTTPNRTIAVIELPSMTQKEVAALLACDTPTVPLPSQLVDAVGALRRARMPLAQIVANIEGIADIASASRLAGLAGAHPHLLKCLDGGHLTLTHAKQLVAKTLEEQKTWAEKAVAHHWSVAQLRARMRAGIEAHTPDADLAAVARTLQDLLGTPVRLEATSAGGYLFAAQWSTVPELQGILEKLACAPTPETALSPGRTRELIISLDSCLEADQLVSHLLPHD